ncbi:MAG: DUF4268 domain-containing protein [Flavobacteriaceae bacterium]|nr:DUF4268 domain-containing protein [Flavobacteriaceae bacterium]
MTNTESIQFEFWKNFKDYVVNRRSKTCLDYYVEPKPRLYIDVKIPNEPSIRVALKRYASRSKKISVEFYITNNMRLYKRFYESKAQFEDLIDTGVHWEPLPESPDSRIRSYKYVENIADVKIQEELFEWLISTSEKFFIAYSRIII